MAARNPKPRVWVAGASGLVGRALLTSLAADPAVGTVTALLRRPLPEGVLPAGIQVLLADPVRWADGELPTLPATDWVACALGTTIRAAGSQAAFRAVDQAAVLAVAQAARRAGATRFGLVSALGADARSPVFYNRVKGEVESALRDQAWPRLVIAQPSLLLGDRAALGQPVRAAERWGQRLMPTLGRWLPARWQAIDAATVARALHRALAAADGPAVDTLDNARLHALGAQGPQRA